MDGQNQHCDYYDRDVLCVVIYNISSAGLFISF